MALPKEKKQEIIQSYQLSKTDTGSTAVQVAVLTERIIDLTRHMKVHALDFSTRRGLLKLVASRRTLLKYMARKSYDQYKNLIDRLGLKR